ncbi:MAG: hypothetical protein L0H39_06765 [Brachybacterium sp.]|nr:hypothetical protein [Brachybacterium sp.]
MTTPTVTERDAAGAMELLASASDEPELLIVLTDEEIVALAGRDTLSLTGSPYLDQEGVDESAHASAALRSLIARGLVVTVDEAMENEGEVVIGDAQDRAMQIDRPIAGLFMLRSTASAVVHVTRQVAEQMTRLVLHVEDDGGVLEEFVSADGFHRFSVPTRTAALERLARFIDPDGLAGDEGGQSVTAPIAELDSAEGELAETLADTRTLSVLTAVSATEAIQVTLFATSGAVFAMDTPEEGESEATVSEQSATDLRELLGEVLDRSTRGTED